MNTMTAIATTAACVLTAAFCSVRAYLVAGHIARAAAYLLAMVPAVLVIAWNAYVALATIVAVIVVSLLIDRRHDRQRATAAGHAEWVDLRY